MRKLLITVFPVATYISTSISIPKAQRTLQKKGNNDYKKQMAKSLCNTMYFTYDRQATLM